MCSRVYLTVRCPSVCLSVRLSANPPLQVCCCGPGGQVISIDCCTAGAQLTAAAAPECGQCRLVSVRRKLNADLFSVRLNRMKTKTDEAAEMPIRSWNSCGSRKPRVRWAFRSFQENGQFHGDFAWKYDKGRCPAAMQFFVTTGAVPAMKPEATAIGDPQDGRWKITSMFDGRRFCIPKFRSIRYSRRHVNDVIGDFRPRPASA